MRAPLTVGWAAGLALGATVAACGPPEPPEPPPAPPEEADAPPLVQAVWDLGRRQASYMERDGDPLDGEVGEDADRDHALILMQGWCYKVMAVAEEGVEDLEVRIFDPRGGLIETDIRQGAEATLGVRRPICPVEHGTYRLQVRAAGGQAGYAVQVYRSI